MQKNSQDFDLQEALRLAKSPAGQQLMEMLQKADKSGIDRAAAAANAGNYGEAAQTLKALLDSGELNAVLRQLGR